MDYNWDLFGQALGRFVLWALLLGGPAAFVGQRAGLVPEVEASTCERAAAESAFVDVADCP